MDLIYHTLDVFTDVVFGGNPLAVFPDGRGLDAATMQRIAREMNLSETVFLLPPETPAGTRRVRIFTPARELPFAGHPTIGTAWFLALDGAARTVRDGSATLVLEENVGPVPVEMTMRGGQPSFARFTTAVLPEHRPGLDRAACARLLSLAPEQIGAPGWEPEMVSCGVPFLIAPVRDLDALGRARLDPAGADELLDGAWATSIYLIAPAGTGVRARMYGHGVGVHEDPATGSAAAALAGYLAKRAGTDGTHRWRVDQGVEMGRPSVLDIEADVRSGAVSAVRVGGRAVAVSRGTLTLPEARA
jgi:trans-2,3-dihydro-3-hydroxyanthranilate isomerase